MKVAPETIRYLAELALLRFDEQECEQLAAQLERIVEFVCQLEQVDVSEVPPTKHVLDVVNAERDDEPRPSLPRERVLALAPEVADGQFVVPRVVHKGEA